MSHRSELIHSDIHAYLVQHERKGLLRFLTCGSVDDGKSTLIGRLLHDSKIIYEDHLAAIRKDSIKFGTTGDDIDLALLVDGLQAEREQGITIDVAYRYFSTARRKFIIADTPGHEQYTRNMATGASTCHLAIILIDARNGVQIQTMRHSFIVSLLGIKHIIVAVNKMDLMGYSEDVFNRIRNDYLMFITSLGNVTRVAHDIYFLPISALKGDNIVNPSDHMPWHQGKMLMQLLETIEVVQDENFRDVRFPVQYVNRPNLDFRGYSGTMAAGVLRPGDSVMAVPSKKISRIKKIVTMDGDLEEAFPPQAITITLEDEIDISRGDMLVDPDNIPLIGDRFNAMIVWMAEDPLLPGKQYYIKQTTKIVNGSISRIHHRIRVNTLVKTPANQVELNKIAYCEVTLTTPLAFDPYSRCKGTGSFILIDKITNVTVGAGMITGLPEDIGVPRVVTADERSARFGQNPVTIWITGESAAELATQLERRLFDLGHASTVLEAKYPQDVTVLIADRMNQAGLICLCPMQRPQNTDAALHWSVSSEGQDADKLIRLLQERGVFK
ncbi:MAG: sulfate adenylyltransferase subunit CysN [Acidobacteria bacterium RIFCSPLOWO2_12_FULL_54_10]|nr:MAG: sulfate adenylyltransferase subunit CysN [Acidobacteria bacterium RIFCSPLOWO2_12_FULL_54_10]